MPDIVFTKISNNYERPLSFSNDGEHKPYIKGELENEILFHICKFDDKFSSNNKTKDESFRCDKSQKECCNSYLSAHQKEKFLQSHESSLFFNGRCDDILFLIDKETDKKCTILIENKNNETIPDCSVYTKFISSQKILEKLEGRELPPSFTLSSDDFKNSKKVFILCILNSITKKLRDYFGKKENVDSSSFNDTEALKNNFGTTPESFTRDSKNLFSVDENDNIITKCRDKVIFITSKDKINVKRYI